MKKSFGELGRIRNKLTQPIRACEGFNPSLVTQSFFHQEEFLALKSPVTKRNIGF